MTRIAITLGDPRGIGPEIAAHVVETPPPTPDPAEFVVIGPDELVASLPCDRIGIGPMGAVASSLDVVAAGRAAGRALEQAVDLALTGAVDGIVTGPMDKYAIHAAGYPYPGHTEWLAALAGGAEVAMMLVVERLRVVLVTTHVPLRAVPDLVTADALARVGRITREGLQKHFGIEHPRLAVCALNPHAGDRGRFGDEDERILRPAARALGAAGPLSADTVFVRALRGEFDAVLAPYHDVGMTAVKVAGFGRGVNVTLGLPFVRTSPDHGTALDIAGRGVADPASMREAVALAVRLAGRRPAVSRRGEPGS